MQPRLRAGQKLPAIQKVSVAKWDADGYFTLRIKVNPEPPISPSGKCYMLSFKQGETDIMVDLGGKSRKVRMTFMLYAKVPATERRATLEQEAKNADAAGEPKLY